MAEMERKYAQITATELWHILVRKSEEQNLGRDFISAVGKVCSAGLDLSQHIIRFFPTFTLHNDIHSLNVCRWMYRLLGDRVEELTAQEAALLLMAACCHDIGMSVSDTQRKTMSSRSYPGWDDYFLRYLDDDEEYCRTGVISEGMLRNFVRQNHHDRIGQNLTHSDWPHELTLRGIRRETLLTLCRSHGTDLEAEKLKCVPGKYDPLLCAVLLRLADLLDYDASRAPEVLFRHMGLDKPGTSEMHRSAEEFGKNQAGVFDESIVNGIIRYYAEFSTPQQEHNVREYLDWVERELNHCADSLLQTGSGWKDLQLPYKISTEDVERRGYAAGKFCMTMDQDKVIELLAGKHLYSDPGVFVRELLQNSIDAVLMRSKQDPNFRLEDGRIIIDTWPGEAGDTWFRIRDNGTGMDEHIINNYFLKVGRSYYTSDEFRAANRHAPGGNTYTAISRFGIGILSCFMCDPEYTELKVSTKRFRAGDENGIRLDVTGLHGYYYLAHEKQHPVYEEAFLEMPSPDENDRGYRQEPGTTICVKTNLFRMGGTQSFREILDRYVQFPEVRVEYREPGNHKVYPTQQELMDAVHALNPDGEVKEYVHPVPPEVLKELKETYFIFEWKEDPALVMRYHPVDWLSDSENMTGVALSVELRYPPEIRHDQIPQSEAKGIGLDWSISISEGIELRVELDGLRDEMRRKTPELWCLNRSIRFYIPPEESGFALSPGEQRVWDLALESLRAVRAGNGHIAYHGVLAAGKDPFQSEYGSSKCCAVLLLRDRFLPEVDMARNRITGLPLETACCHAMACNRLGKFSRNYDLVDDGYRKLLTERELREVLQRYPRWRKPLLDKWEIGESNKPEYYLSFNYYVLDCLSICNARQTGAVCHDFGNAYNRRFVISETPADTCIVDFPVTMFAMPTTADAPLARIVWSGVFYNCEHIFSRWLIENRAALVKKVPAVYDTLIRAMVLSEEKDKIVDAVNIILTRLRNFEGNCFGIHDSLFIKAEDFA